MFEKTAFDLALVICLALPLSAIAGTFEACQSKFAQIEKAVPSAVQTAAAASLPEIRELTVGELNQTALRSVREGKTFSYIVDANGKAYAVAGQLPFSRDGFQVAKVRDAKGAEALIPIHESGTIAYDPKLKKFSFQAGYSLDLAQEERASLMEQVQKINPGTSFGHEELPGNSFSQVLSCADLLSAQLNGKNWQLDKLSTRLGLSTTTLALKDYDVRKKYEDDSESREAAERKLFLVFGVDTFRRAGTTWASGVVGKQLVERGYGNVASYSARLTTGVASNWVAKEATDQLDPLIKKLQDGGKRPGNKSKDSKAEMTPDLAWKIMLYNNGTQVISPPIGQFFDKRVLDSSPMNYYDACRKGRKLKFVVGPRMMRIYESGILTIIGLPKYFLWGV